MKAQPLHRTAGREPGEDMNVRHVHAAIWREEAEPSEFVNRLPALLRHFYFLMFLWMLFYLGTWMGGWNWNEYEASLMDRLNRDRARPQPAATALPH
jgi:hypothetical protein